MGIVPGWDGIERLVRTVGRSAAMKLLLGADQHDAHSACALGLVDIACDTGTALDAALAFALSLDDKSRDSIIEIKRLVRASVDTPGEIRALTREAFARLWFGPDHRAAQSAAARR
jgi:enoyl-CoA hydratase